VALGHGHRLLAALARGRDRDRLRREPLMRATRDLEVGSADRPGELCSFGQVALGVRESPGPGLDDPEIQERDCAAFATHRNLIVRFIRDRSVEQVHLVDHVAEPTATPG
jgi:hypothetical protein